MIYHKAVITKDPAFPRFTAGTSLDDRTPDDVGSKALSATADVDRKTVMVDIVEHTVLRGWVDQRIQLNAEQGQALFDFLMSVYGPT